MSRRTFAILGIAALVLAALMAMAYRRDIHAARDRLAAGSTIANTAWSQQAPLVAAPGEHRKKHRVQY